MTLACYNGVVREGLFYWRSILQTGTTSTPVEVMIVVGGMGLVFLGLMQFISKFMRSNEKRRSEIFSQLEETKLKNVELQGLLDQREHELIDTKDLYQKYRTLYRASKKTPTGDTAELDLVEPK